jgi:hypothetical protein
MEDAAGSPEYRGTVRDVMTGAFCGFRDWSDLAEFMIAWTAEGKRDPVQLSKGNA